MTQTLDDLGIDSLGLVESIFAIEEAFDISVPFNANEPDEVRVRHLLRRRHRRGGREAGGRTARMKRVVITGAGTINPLGHTRPRHPRGDARGPLRHRPARDARRRTAVDPRSAGRSKDYDPDDALQPPAAGALRPLHPVHAARRARGDRAGRARDSRASSRPRRASSSAPRAAGSRPRTRTTAPSTRRGRTASTPSSCRS